MKKELIQDGWEDCISVIKRLINERLDLESKSAAQWGNEPALFIESFRKIVDDVCSPL